MQDINDYWKVLDYPPFFTNIDWNGNQSSTANNNTNDSTFIPMEFSQQKIAAPPPPFQRRRSSSVDLPINPLYSNRFTNEPTIHEEELPIIKHETIPTLGYPSSTAAATTDITTNHNAPTNNLLVTTDASPSLSPCSSITNDENMISSPSNPKLQYPSSLLHHSPQQIKYPPSPPSSHQQTTYFPELHRTSYNLGKQLRQHTKRRRSSSLPPAFHGTNKTKQAPIIFTQIQVTDPTPIQHTQKAPKIDAPPIAIERAPKKKVQTTKPTAPSDPILKQRQLDEKLMRLNFEDVTVAELKELLKERGSSTIGKKAVLIDRLKDARNHLLTGIKPPTPPKDTIHPIVASTAAAISASPAIQGLANMTIHSPNLFSPMVEDTTNQSTTSSSSYNTATDQLNTYQNDMNLNDLFDFDTILDSNAILFPSQQDQEHPDWSQDTLDHFLTELV